MISTAERDLDLQLDMAFYDLFSNIYDAALEPVYAEHRKLAAAALELRPGSIVLDLPCGTGQGFDAIAGAIGPDGLLLGVDASAGMLRRAGARVERSGLSNVRLLQARAGELQASQLQAAAGRAVSVTHLHVFLGMSVFPEFERAFEQLWQLLTPAGVCVLVDVHAERLGVQGWLVNQIARAEIRRRFWEPLERVAIDFERSDLPYNKQHGGQIMLARGRKRA